MRGDDSIVSITSGDTGFAAEHGSTRPGMPDPGSSLHIASVDYYCTFSLLASASGKASFSVPDPVRFTFAFETGQVEVSPGVFRVSWDYSSFDQTTAEANIAFALSQIVSAVAEMLALTIGQVNAAVLIRRIWTFAPNLQGLASGNGRVVTTDVMTYPPRASSDLVISRQAGRVSVLLTGADAAHARDGSRSFGGDWVHAVESASHVP